MRANVPAPAQRMQSLSLQAPICCGHRLSRHCLQDCGQGCSNRTTDQPVESLESACKENRSVSSDAGMVQYTRCCDECTPSTTKELGACVVYETRFTHSPALRFATMKGQGTAYLH